MTRFFVFFLFCGFVFSPVFTKAEKPVPLAYALTAQPTDSMEITVADNRIILSNAPVGSKLQVFSVVGVKVKEIEIKQPSGEYLLNIAKGYYIIRIADVVRKIAIR